MFHLVNQFSSPSTTSKSGQSGLSAWLPRCYLPLLLLSVAAFAWRPLKGIDDFWAHAAIGRWIWEHHQVPTQTLFLWSAKPQPWIAHSWLSQLAFYGLMRAGGENGGPFLALLLTLGISALTWFLLWRLWARNGRITVLTALLFAFGIWVASARFHPRPELFSALFLALLLVFLADWPRHDTRQKWKSIGLIAMFALWANFHGGVALGLLLLWTSAVLEALQGRFSPRACRLLLLALACTLAINFNPYGVAYWSALQPVASPMFKRIDEWKPLWAAPALPPEALIGVGALLLVPFFAWLKNPQRRWMQLGWLLVMALMIGLARRHLWSLSQVGVAVMAANAGALEAGVLLRTSGVKNVSALWRLSARAATLGVLLAWIVAGLPEELGPRAVDKRLPVRLARRLQVLQSQHSGPLFNEYLMSSYLQWHFGGHPPLGIDLLNAYPDQLLADYFDAIAAKARGLRWIEDHNVTIIALPPSNYAVGTRPLRRVLSQNSSWIRVYDEIDGTIWMRRKIISAK